MAEAAAPNRIMRRVQKWIQNNTTGPTGIKSVASLENLTWNTQACALFKLAPEIRRKIMIEAFGNRIIHIDFRHRRPPYTFETSGGQEPRHGGYPPDIKWPEVSPKFPPKRRPKKPSWQWYSCVCHRIPPPDDPSDPPLSQPAYDTCLEGNADYCTAWEGNCPDKCMVGAMGLLQSCKQAYLEAIEVLYSTNTMFMEDRDMIMNILRRQQPSVSSGRLIGPAISMITSLQLKWMFILWGDTSGRSEESERVLFDETLELLPRAFPNLSRLYIAFEDHLFNQITVSPRKSADELDSILWKPMAKMAANARLEHFVAAVPLIVFDVVRDLSPETPDNSEAVLRAKGIWGLRYWYPLDKYEERGQRGKGYWIKYSVEGDLQFPKNESPFFLSAPPPI